MDQWEAEDSLPRLTRIAMAAREMNNGLEGGEVILSVPVPGSESSLFA